MGSTPFATLIDRELAKLKEAVMTMAPNDWNLARMQGRHAGLLEAKELYRRAMREDTEETL